MSRVEMPETDGESFFRTVQLETERAIRRAIESAIARKSAPDAGTVAAMAEEAAVSLAYDLLFDWGGQQVYIPLRGKMVKEAVLHEWDGTNAAELSRKYRVSRGTMYKYLADAREDKKEQLQQARLPGVE